MVLLHRRKNQYILDDLTKMEQLAILAIHLKWNLLFVVYMQYYITNVIPVILHCCSASSSETPINNEDHSIYTWGHKTRHSDQVGVKDMQMFAMLHTLGNKQKRDLMIS